MANCRDGAVLGSIRSLFEAGTSVGLDDAELLDRFLTARDEVARAAFESLATRHGPMVLGVCRDILRDSHDAQDAFQATFLVLARKAGSIRRREKLASWLFGVARKVAVRAKADAARRRARERVAGVPPMAEPGPAREPEDLAALHEEIDRLPGIYREPVVLCYLEGMTYEAAARQLRCPPGTLSVRLKRARERLRSRLTRRGVVVPSGFLVAGSCPNAVVPTALAGRPALTWLVREATAAGTVPAAVASLAGRTMAMMRYKAFGVGLLAMGGVVLAASASLAMRTTEKAREVPEQQPAAKQARPWVRNLTGGVTVELIGVSAHPAGPGTWKTPDGAALPTPPYARSGSKLFPAEGEKAREFAVRVGNLPDDGISRRWRILPPPGSSSSGTTRYANDKFVPRTEMFAACLPADRRACTVRFGVASGRWKTEISDGPEGSAQGREKLSAIFGKAREDGGKTALTISHDESEDDLRVVAVDQDGREHAPVRSSASGVRNFLQREVEYDLALSKVKEFRLQSRPFEWAVFEDVALDPRGD